MENPELKWKELLKHNMRIQDVFEHVAIGDELKILSPYLEAMTIVAAANTLKGGASYFFLSQYLATIGIDKETSPCGFVGKSLNLLVDKISETLSSEICFSKKIEIGEKMVLKKIVKGVAISSITAGKILSLKMGLLQKDEKEKEKEISRVHMELIMLLLASSSALKVMFKEMISLVSSDEKTTMIGSEILFLFAILLIGFGVAKQMYSFDKVFELLNPYFYTSLRKIEEFLRLKASSDADLQLSSAIAILNQGLLSLKSGKSEDFVQTIENSLESFAIAKSDLQQDIVEVEKSVDQVYKTLSSGLKDFLQSDTEIIVVA